MPKLYRKGSASSFFLLLKFGMKSIFIARIFQKCGQIRSEFFRNIAFLKNQDMDAMTFLENPNNIDGNLDQEVKLRK